MPLNIDGTDISSATIDGENVSEITIDGQTVFTAIPDSEANQKLIHRWYLSEASAPFVDQIGSADGSNNGTTQVTGDYFDGAAREGDGVDDYIETTTLGMFGAQRENGDFAYAFTIVPTDVTDDSFIAGSNNASFGNGQIVGNIRFAGAGNSGEITLREHDANDNRMVVRSETGHMANGNPYRVVINAVGNDATNWEIYINQTDRTNNVEDNDGLSNCENLDHPYPFFCRNDNTNIREFGNFILDDFCIFDDSLTTTEAQSYTNPWS